jgi:lysophospholipase L1-like esterase
MRVIVAALGAAIVCTGQALAQDPLSCAVPDYLLLSDSKLKHVAASVPKHKKLVILVVGTGSSTLAGPDGANLAYPARLAAKLTDKLPGVAVSVVPRVKGGQTAEDMRRGLKALLAAEKPDLVIWQVGTIDAIKRVPPDDFRTALEEGVEAISGAGADAVLMNSQYSPRTESMIALGPYADNIRAVVHQRRVPLFDRFAIMRYWSDYNVFDFNTAGRDLGLARRVHDCIGSAMATFILDSGKLQYLERKAGN